MDTRYSAEEIAAAMGSLRGLARALVRDACAADDAVQETLLRALASPPRKGPTTRAWFTTVLENVVRKRWREEARRKAREACAGRRQAPLEPVVHLTRTEQLGALVDALRRLAPEKREIVELRYLEGLLPAAIAAHLDCPVETVKTRLKRGVAELRRMLDDEQGPSWPARLAVALSISPEDVGASTSHALGEALTGAGPWPVLALVLVVLGVAVGVVVLSSTEDADHEASVVGVVPSNADRPPAARHPGATADRPPAEAASTQPKRSGPRLTGSGQPDPRPVKGASKPEPRTPVPPHDIEALITRLAELGDYGMNARFSATPRLDGTAPRTSPRGAAAVLALIRQGPAAVPSLLGALEDDRKTRITLPAAFGSRPVPLSSDAGDLAGSGERSYTVRVGDVCYLILGQIVGKRDHHFIGWHRAGRGRNQALTMTIRSPVLNEARRAQVRKEFEDGADPEDVVFRMLKAGFASGSLHLASRLLYYFPARSAELVVASIRAGADRAEFARLIGYVCDFDVDPVQSELMRVFLSANDMEVVDACLTPHLLARDRPAVEKRLGACLAEPPRERTNAQFLAQQRMLAKAVALFPADARALLTTYGDLHDYRCRTAALVETGKLIGATSWTVPYLARFLEDRSEGWRGYRVERVRYPMRVCDVAAVALAKQIPGAEFTLDGGPEALDRQIARLAEQAYKFGGR